MKKQPKKQRRTSSQARPAGSKKKVYARVGKILTTTLYCYVEPKNAEHARVQGKSPKYGTFSAYVNALIAKDRGVAPAQGTRGQEMVGKKLPKSHNPNGKTTSKKSGTSKTSAGKKSDASKKKSAMTKGSKKKSSAKTTSSKKLTNFKVGQKKSFGSKKVIARAKVTKVDTSKGEVTLAPETAAPSGFPPEAAPENQAAL